MTLPLMKRVSTRLLVILCMSCAPFAECVLAPLGCADEKQCAGADVRKVEIPYPLYKGSYLSRSEQLKPWIQDYLSFGEDFEKRNRLAFGVARYTTDTWYATLSFMALDPELSDESLMAISHLTSAYYARVTGPMDACGCLDDDFAWIVAGQLKVLRVARQLRPDGSDRVWPKSGVLGPRLLPRYIAQVLHKHPMLEIDVAQTLEVYGPLALKEARNLLPLLLSNDDDVVMAAQSAIRSMDPDGLAKTFQLEGEMPLTVSQRKSISDYLNEPAVEDTRESDGSPQTEMSKRYEELLWFMRQRENNLDPDPVADRELALRFRDEKTPGDWWRVLSSAEFAFEFLEFDDLVDQFASAIYTESGTQAAILNVLKDDDPRIVKGAMSLICALRPFTSATAEINADELVDPEVMPAQFAQVLNRHPHLYIDVSHRLRRYGSHSRGQLNLLIPYLFSDDSYVVTRTKGAITRIDPNLAKQLGIVEEEFLFFLEDSKTMKTLTPKQRDVVQDYLKGRVEKGDASN